MRELLNHRAAIALALLLAPALAAAGAPEAAQSDSLGVQADATDEVLRERAEQDSVVGLSDWGFSVLGDTALVRMVPVSPEDAVAFARDYGLEQGLGGWLLTLRTARGGRVWWVIQNKLWRGHRCYGGRKLFVSAQTGAVGDTSRYTAMIGSTTERVSISEELRLAPEPVQPSDASN